MLVNLGNLTSITPEVVEALGAAFKTYLESEMVKKPTWHRQFFADIAATDLAVAVQILTSPLRLVPWITDRVIQNIGKRLKVVTLETLECSVGIDRNDVLYASLRAQLPGVLNGMGLVEDQWIIDQLHDYLANGHGSGPAYAGIDDQPIFSVAHPIEKKFVTAGVQRNYWNDLDLTAGNIVVVRDAMKAYKGENGIRLGIRPTILWYSPNLAATAETLINLKTDAGTTIVTGQFELQEIENLDTDNLWGLYDPKFVGKPFAFMHAIKTAMRWIQQPGEVVRQGIYGYDEDAGTAPLFWAAISKAVHTP